MFIIVRKIYVHYREKNSEHQLKTLFIPEWFWIWKQI